MLQCQICTKVEVEEMNMYNTVEKCREAELTARRPKCTDRYAALASASEAGDTLDLVR